MTKNYYEISKEELGIDSKIDLLKLKETGEVFYEIALDMIGEIEKNNKENRNTVFICPVGPVGQYEIFTRLVNERRLSLKRCWFINMDEYLNEDLEWIDKEERLSFRGFMDRVVYSNIAADLVMPKEQRLFPNPRDPESLDRKIQELGGVDVCYGGVGINGHLAFNEADDSLSVEEFSKLPTRVMKIARETVAINSVGDLSGAMELMPKNCVTLGMKNIVGARRVVLACFRDWHRAVVRRACYGEISSAFPVTLIQNHPKAKLIINENVAENVY